MKLFWIYIVAIHLIVFLSKVHASVDLPTLTNEQETFDCVTDLSQSMNNCFDDGLMDYEPQQNIINVPTMPLLDEISRDSGIVEIDYE